MLTGPQNENVSRTVADIVYSQKQQGSRSSSGVSDFYRRSSYTEVAGGPGCLATTHIKAKGTRTLPSKLGLI